MKSKEYFYELISKSGKLTAYAKVSNIRTNKSKVKMSDIEILNITNFKIHRTAGNLTDFINDTKMITDEAEVAKLKLLGL